MKNDSVYVDLLEGDPTLLVLLSLAAGETRSHK